MEQFLALSKMDQADILHAKAPELGMSPEVLEKDVQVCRALGLLFAVPNIPQMAFKGGTSLSKGYRAIERFSEDLDVTVDHNGLIPGEDPFHEGYSGTKSRKLTERLRAALLTLLKDRIVPALNESITPDESLVLRDEDATVLLYYVSCLEGNLKSYIRQCVQIEFGGRNSTEPREAMRIKSYLGETVPGLIFPEAEVQVLKGTRTFWEKVTLIHAEINRRGERDNFDRFSRHWYDLYRLADHEIGKRAMAEDFDLLGDVVKYKTIFFRRSDAKYENCLNHGVRLIPENRLLSELEKDYRKMRDAGMFYGNPPTFAEIVERLKTLEEEVNKSRMN